MNGENLNSVRFETGISYRTKKEYVKWGEDKNDHRFSPTLIFLQLSLSVFLPPLLPVVTCILDIILSLSLRSQLINVVDGGYVYSVGLGEEADHLNLHCHVRSVPYPNVNI
jgi:hypothetical protein